MARTDSVRNREKHVMINLLDFIVLNSVLFLILRLQIYMKIVIYKPAG